ncbi:hypothetical protein H8958_021772 [Nasalis larvatus]
MNTVERNLVRVAEVWLDEYKELFYGHGDHLIDQGLDVDNLTQQRELRKKLKCKSFKCSSASFKTLGKYQVPGTNLSIEDKTAVC